MENRVFTIGHSTHDIERFIALLRQHGVTALCDVRSKPYSRLNPQFNREPLKRSLQDHGIAYVFLGAELGARSDDPSCYDQGKVKYDRLAETPLFQQGLARVTEGMKKYRLALMCAEREPVECHRTILVARHLAARGVDVAHIHADGRIESHADALSRLLQTFKLQGGDMFRSQPELLAEAYRLQEERIAYTFPEPASAAGSRLRNAGE